MKPSRTKNPLIFTVSFLFMFSFLSAADETVSIFKLGERFFSDSLYNLALEQYQKYLNVRPRGPENDPTAYFKIAMCHYYMENQRKAAESFEEFIKLFPSETNVMDAMYMAGVTRKALGDYKEASDWFYSVWSRFVGSVKAMNALFEAAECARKDNNFERSIELFGLFFSRFPKQEKAKEASLSLVEIHVDRKEYAQAEKILDEAEKQFKGNDEFSVRVIYYKALLNDRMQKKEPALKLYKAMKDRDSRGFPEMEQAYTDYVNLLVEQKQYPEALGIYDKIRDIYQKSGKVPDKIFINSWADCARKAKNYSKAVDLYRQLIDKYEESDKNIILYRIAECYTGMGDFPRSIETLQMLESSDSSTEYSAKAAQKIGDLYFSKELYPSAIAAYRRYLQLPDREDKDKIIFRIGKIYKDKYGRYNAALREFENLLKWYPASPYYLPSVYAIAQCYEMAKEYTAAIRQYEFIIESGGDEELVNDAEGRIHYLKTFKIKDSENAMNKMAELLQHTPDQLSDYSRLMKTAEIYTESLKDYNKAMDIYEQIFKLNSFPSDTLIPQVKLKQADLYQLLYEKAVFESDSQLAGYTYKRSLAIYEDILKNHTASSSVDKAAYSILTLTKPNIGEYEDFIAKYPNSRYLPDVLLSIAEHYEKRSQEAGEKFSKKVVDAYQHIVTQFPASQHASRSLLGLARNYLVLNELDSVRNVIDMFVERFPNSPAIPEVHYIKGIITKKNNNLESASDIFKQVLYKYPFSPYAAKSRFELAFIELNTGDVFSALNDFRIFEQSYPSDPAIYEVQYGMAKCQLRLGKITEAKNQFLDLLDKGLDQALVADIQFEMGNIAEKENDTYKAIDYYSKALEYDRFPNRGKVYSRMGDLYFKIRIYNDAAASFEAARPFAENKSDSIKILTNLAVSLIMSGDSKKADKVISFFKDNFGGYTNNLAEIYYYQGVYLLSEKKFEKALSHFNYIIKKYDQSDRVDDAEYQTALCYYYDNKIEEAFRLFYEFPTKFPQSEYVPLAYFKIATIKHDQDDFAQAADYFSRVVSNKNADSITRFRAAYNAAVAYQKISSWLDAEKMYTIVMNEFGDQLSPSSIHLKIGFCLLQASRVEDALAHFQKANVNPSAEEKPELLYWIGTCYSKLGEYQNAIGEYLKVPYLYSGMGKWGVTAEMEAARIYERLNEFDKAISLYKKIIRSDGENGRFGRQALQRIELLSSIVKEQ